MLCGCGFIRQVTSPSLAALEPYGASTVPDDAGRIMFVRRSLDDDKLAAAFRYLHQYEPQDLRFDGRQITDLSVSLLIQLDSVEVLDLAGTQITKAGLKRLRLMRGLRQLWVSDTMSPQDIDEIRHEMPKGVTVEGVRTMLGAQANPPGVSRHPYCENATGEPNTLP